MVTEVCNVASTEALLLCIQREWKHRAFCYVKKMIIYIVVIETVIISGNRETDFSTQVQNVSC